MQIIINILVTAGLALLVGFACQTTTTGFRHFHAGVAVAASLGGYTFILLTERQLPAVSSAVGAIIIGTILGLAFDLFLAARLRRDGLKPLGLFLATLAGWVVVQSVISMGIGDEIRSALVENRKAWRLLGGVITQKQACAITSPILIAFGIQWCLQRTSWGLRFRGFCSNPDLANNFGVSQRQGELLTAIVGFACAAYAGILESILFGIAPLSAFRIWLVGIVVFIVAGFGSYNGLFFSALLVATVSHLATFWGGGEWVQAAMFAVLIAFLLWKPLGFSGRRLKKVEI